MKRKRRDSEEDFGDFDGDHPEVELYNLQVNDCCYHSAGMKISFGVNYIYNIVKNRLDTEGIRTKYHLIEENIEFKYIDSIICKFG